MNKIPAEPPFCQRCGTQAKAIGTSFCRRCGLPYNVPPVEIDEDLGLAECPICYDRADRNGTFRGAMGRTTYEQHAFAHDAKPVGDDDYLESLREGDQIRIGRWTAPFDIVRRYLVTGAWEAGRNRAYAHNAVVMAMVGMARNPAAFGPEPVVAPRKRFLRKPLDALPNPDAVMEARRQVADLMERYKRGTD
jgi:hypothetical protein